MKTVFSKIIEGELPCTKVYESEKVIAFKDINPIAPVHLLIVSKKPIPCLQAMEAEDYPLMAEFVEVAQKLAKQFGVEDCYRLVTNNGSGAGQIIFHLHFHLIGGRSLGALG